MIEKGVKELRISYTKQKLEERLIQFFGDKICSGANKANMIYSSKTTCDNGMGVAVTIKDNLKTKLGM